MNKFKLIQLVCKIRDLINLQLIKNNFMGFSYHYSTKPNQTSSNFMINSHFSVILLVLFTFRLIAFKRSGHIARTAAKQLVLIDVLSKKKK